MNVFRWYLSTAIYFGKIDHAYRVSSKWGENGTHKWRYNAADAMTEKLIKEHGYYRCEACQWAAKSRTEHMTIGSWCDTDMFQQRYKLHPDELVGTSPGRPAGLLLPRYWLTE